jgi:hypothetical protein
MTTEYQNPAPPSQVPVAPPYPPDRRDRFVDDPRRKSVMWAVILSAMPGLGHVYVGYYREAFRNISVVCLLVLLLSTNALHRIEPPFVMFLIFFILFTIVDAGRRASLYNQALSLYNQALAGLRPMDLPEDAPQGLSPLTAGGSLAGGVVLVVLRLIFFTNTMFGWSLQWVGSWWPLGFVAAGAWLIYADVQAKRAGQARQMDAAAASGPAIDEP